MKTEMTETKKIEIGNIYNIGIGFGESADAKVVKIDGDQAVLEMIDFGGPLQRVAVSSL